MARVRKKRYQLLRNVVLGALVFLMASILILGLLQGLIVFMLTGNIAGTPLTVPTWGMVLLYVGVAGMLLIGRLDDRFRPKL